MRKNVFLNVLRTAIIALLMIVSSIEIFGQERGQGLKTAIVNYKYTMNSNAMEMVMYYADYGNYQCFKYDVEGIPYATIVTPDSVMEINYAVQGYRKYAKSHLDINFNQLTPSIIKKFDINSPGTVEFMDKSCTIFNAKFKNEEILEMMVWLFQGVELRRQITYKDQTKTNLLATYLEENPEISEQTFKDPDGFERYK